MRKGRSLVVVPALSCLFSDTLFILLLVCRALHVGLITAGRVSRGGWLMADTGEKLEGERC